MLTLTEAATFVRVSKNTLGDLARRNRIPSKKVGREWRFLRSALVDWLANKETDQPHSTGQNGAQESVQTRFVFSALSADASLPTKHKNGFRDTAFAQNQGQSVHRWVPWIAGFSGDFVADVLRRAEGRPPNEVTVLDPFAGVGTTLVEAIKRGHQSVGFEINPYAALACRAKVECLQNNPRQISLLRRKFLTYMKSHDKKSPKSSAPEAFNSRAPFFSKKVERKVLHVLDFIRRQKVTWLRDVMTLALGSLLVSFSNYSYEPSLSRRSVAGKPEVQDADVAGVIAAKLQEILTDSAEMKLLVALKRIRPLAQVYCASFLTEYKQVRARSVDFLITSPPYLNNYHYIRNTRPHLYWLGLAKENLQLRRLEQSNFGKYWQTVRAAPPIDLEFSSPRLEKQLQHLREQNTHKGVYGGAGWANYAVAYFNDCYRFCEAAHSLMKGGGTAVVVIGNNILQGIEFKTDEIFAEIAGRNGFEVVALHRVREKRTGSSIIHSSVRSGQTKQKASLYETAVELRA
ncbi:MAG: helix-turn-helix domain-containing protein [Planctomycetota bacterium]|nr:helix-turn-helix domain-containing protein [Planctomycetota bacterium]